MISTKLKFFESDGEFATTRFQPAPKRGAITVNPVLIRYGWRSDYHSIFRTSFVSHKGDAPILALVVPVASHFFHFDGSAKQGRRCPIQMKRLRAYNALPLGQSGWHHVGIAGGFGGGDTIHYGFGS
jgi:hypothetical protein